MDFLLKINSSLKFLFKARRQASQVFTAEKIPWRIKHFSDHGILLYFPNSDIKVPNTAYESEFFKYSTYNLISKTSKSSNLKYLIV